MTAKQLFAKPPLGVLPFYLWAEDHEEPTIEELVARHRDVCEAIYRREGSEHGVPLEWYIETGLVQGAVWR